MTIRNVLIACLCLPALSVAMEQEETFTDLEPGSRMLDPAGLSIEVAKGNVRAMNNVGLLWFKGYDGKQSYEEALKWWHAAADRGYPVSMNNIGLAYANGHGVEQNMEKAFEWWFRAAFAGDAWAMNSVGDCYETGEGVARNPEMAMTWYQSAAKEGDVLAHYNIASLYERGLGTERDLEEALAWYRKAAGGGDAASMRAIGRFYREGLGVEVDLVEAYAWHRVAQMRFKPQEEQEAGLNLKEAERVMAMLSSMQLKNADARIIQLEALTAPTRPEPKKPLDPHETRI